MSDGSERRRYTVDIPVELLDAQTLARADDGISVAARVRLLLALWAQDEQLRERVLDLARQRRVDGQRL